MVYPEVGRWDLVLTKGADQVGVQAKLVANIKVLAQAVAASGRQGPDFRAVLVPRASSDFMTVCRKLGVGVFTAQYERRSRWVELATGFYLAVKAAPCAPAQRLWLPPVVAALPAGGPAPKQLTVWRVKALQVCRLLRARGWVTSRDFKNAKISPQTWVTSRWLVATKARVRVDPKGHEVATGGTLLTKYVAGPSGLPDFGWEEVSSQLAAQEELDNQHAAVVEKEEPEEKNLQEQK